jgi:RNA polymerase sigma-70 factor (ECF subfamily)
MWSMGGPDVEDSAAAAVTWSLVARAAAGERPARRVFTCSYLPVVRTFLGARWRGTRLDGEIDDAVQEVFIECLRENGVLAGADARRGDLRGLLFGVSRNVAARFEERARRRPAPDEAPALEELQARESSLSALFDGEWARSVLRLAGERQRELAREDPGARMRVEVLTLRFGRGMAIHDIAAAWDVDAEVLHRAYARAREEFRACLRAVVAQQAVRSEVDLDDEVGRILELIR